MGREREPEGVRVSVDGTRSLDTAVVRALAEATGREPLAIPPLYESLDLAALDALVSGNGDVHVEFEHAGCAVTVDGKTITVEPL